MTETKRNAPCTEATGKGAKVVHTTENDNKKAAGSQGRRFRDYHIEHLDIRFREFGSMNRIKAVDRICDEAEETLKPCPFCGGKAVIQATFGYYLPGVYTGCTHCHGNSGVVTQGKNLLTGKHVTIEECIETSVKRWNSRKEAEAV